MTGFCDAAAALAVAVSATLAAGGAADATTGSVPKVASAGATTGSVPKVASAECFWVGPYTTRRGPRYNHAFPDDGAIYWSARFKMPPGSRLELHGRFPHSRYTSFNSYDAATAAPVDGLPDIEIGADPGSTNPFLPGARRDGRNRDYRVTVSPSAPPNRAAHNTIYAGVAGQPDQQLIYRVYLPDRKRDLTGDTGLPQPRLTLADGTTAGDQVCAALGSSQNELNPSSLPLETYLSLRDQPGKPPTFPARNPPRVRAYYSTAFTIACVYQGDCEQRPQRIGGQYSNADVQYAGSYVNRGFGEVLVLRGRLPITPRTSRGEKRMTRGQMRYWSLCQNESLATTRGAGCLYDEEIPLDSQRRYTIVTSKPEDRPRNARTRCGVAWVAWPAEGDGAGHPDDALLLMRNLLPDDDFDQAVHHTRVPGDEKKVMGPYLFRGEYMTTKEFERRDC